MNLRLAFTIAFLAGGCATKSVHSPAVSHPPVPDALKGCVPNPPVLNHIGFFVPSIDKTLANYRAMGFPEPHEIGTNRDKGYKVAVIHVGGTHLEFIEPVNGPKGPHPYLTSWLKKNGEGMHHMAFNVPNVRKAVQCVTAKGIKMSPRFPEPVAGATGWISFTDPASTGNVNIELVQPFSKPGLFAESGPAPE